MYIFACNPGLCIISSVEISDKLTALLCNLLQFQKHKKSIFFLAKKNCIAVGAKKIVMQRVMIRVNCVWSNSQNSLVY